jgi:hypothetical protein
MANNTIVLKGIGHHDEGVADATIYPGEAVRMAADSHYDPETLAPVLAAGRGLKLAKEDALQGKTVDDAYAAGDILSFYSPVNGDHVAVLVKTGENIAVGDYLVVEGSGSGKFVEAASSSTASYELPLTSARVHDSLGTLLPTAIANTTETIPIPLTAGKVHDAMATDLPTAAANDDMGIITGTPGTDAPTLQGVDFGGTTSDEKAAFEIILPQNYVAGSAVTLRARAGMLVVADTSCTLDCEAWETTVAGAVGADICATAAQSINSATYANIDFTITPTNLVAGDTLIVRLSFNGTDSGNAAPNITAEISDLFMIYTTDVIADDMALITGTPGTDAPTLQGSDFGGTTADEKCAFEVVLPQEYRAGSSVTLRAYAGMLTTVSHVSCTLDCEAWESDGAGAVGADICATAAQSINSLTFANKDFTITPTNLVAGDKLIIRLSIAGTDDTDAGVMIPEIAKVSLLVGNAIAGQLEALESSGGALAAATLIKCRVLNP